MNTMTVAQELGKVGVLYGGRSAEREVSLMSGEGVDGIAAMIGNIRFDTVICPS